MKQNEIAQRLQAHTILNSNFEERRDYISLSNIHKPSDELWADFKNGYSATDLERLRCYKGYQMEADIRYRLKAAFPDDVYMNPKEVIAKNGLFKGHPDFEFKGYPGEIKSVLMDDWLPKDGKLPRKTFYQIQAYMLYGEKEKGLVIYESRESGLISEYWVTPNRRVVDDIKQKVELLYERWKNEN